jgi:uncharacterized membrane protein YfcA
MEQLLMLGTAGLVGGAMNALAGGGSFVTLPAMIAAGIPSVGANASSTVALYPGGAASVWVYRHGLTNVQGVPFLPSLIATLIGGLAGALLLVSTPSSVFDGVLPFLLLIATLMLLLGGRLGAALRARFAAGPVAVTAIQFVLGVYGGYFGGGVGLMMLAAWSLVARADIKALNPLRMTMVTAANTIAVVCFVALGVVWWRQAFALGLGAIVGGYVGAHVARRLPAAVVRGVTIGVAVTITISFFYRAYFRS